MSHILIRNAQPIAPNDLATKAYVDAASNYRYKAGVKTRAALPPFGEPGDAVWVEDEDALYIWDGPPEPNVVDALAAIDDGKTFDQLVGRWLAVSARGEC